MSERTLLESSVSPITQSTDAVEGLLNSLGRPTEPLPGVVDLDSVKLVLSNKKDVYYTVTAKECSCPSATYRGGPCKHIRKYFPEPKKAAKPMPTKSLLPTLHPPPPLPKMWASLDLAKITCATYG